MKQNKKQKQPDKDHLEDVRKKLKECKRLEEEYLAGWQRTKADFLNYQKGESKRVEAVLSLIKTEWILKMLDIHDNFLEKMAFRE